MNVDNVVVDDDTEDKPIKHILENDESNELNLKKQKISTLEEKSTESDEEEEEEEDDDDDDDDEEEKDYSTCDDCGEKHSNNSDDEHIQCEACWKYKHILSYEKNNPYGWSTLKYHSEDRLWDGLCPKHSGIPEHDKSRKTINKLKEMMSILTNDDAYVLFCKSNKNGKDLDTLLNEIINNKE